MFNLTSHAFATLTHELWSWKLEEKFHINTCPWIILCMFYPINVALCYVRKRMEGRGGRGGGEGEERERRGGKNLGSSEIISIENSMSLQMKNIHSLWPALLRCIWTWVTPPKRVTLLTWSPPPLCKQALNLHAQLQLGGPLWLPLTDYSLFNMMYEL